MQRIAGFYNVYLLVGEQIVETFQNGGFMECMWDNAFPDDDQILTLISICADQMTAKLVEQPKSVWCF